jgi:hypothetical protein
MDHHDEGEALVHRFRSDHVQRLERLDPSEQQDLLEAVRQLGAAWSAHRSAASEQERTRALREVDAAMVELDLVAERILATHSDEDLARALRSLQV